MRILVRAVFGMLLSSWALAGTLPEPAPAQLPRWRGFNLLEKFHFQGRHEPFVEDDFRMISELGFNFVRLPIDYRGYIAGGDWERFEERALAQLDQAVEWGGRYGVHVCLNLHRAPGWTVAKPPEPTNLWTDPEPRRVAALHWGMFARRYRGMPNARLSFNLFNEPAGIETETYQAVVESMLAAIRAADPARLVLCDGVKWGMQPVEAFIPLGVAMMTRGYLPMEVSHFRAGWIQGSEGWGMPSWPFSAGTNGALLGPAKGADSHPLRIEGPIAAGSVVRLVVATLSSQATITVAADGREIWRHELVAVAGDPRWRKVELDPQWNIWRAEGQLELRAPVPEAAGSLELRTVAGDWLVLQALAITGPGGGREAAVGLTNRWGQAPEVLVYQPVAAGGPLLGAARDRAWLQREAIDPWRGFAARGGGVMVGEWGAFHHTPHEVVLRWAEDCLRNWQEAGWGWALWNFRGPFGVLDSGRKDVTYEDFQGHQLDRRLLDLLRRY
jgi:hypothetical protein